MMRWSRVGWPAIGYVSLEDDDGYGDHLRKLLIDCPPTVSLLAGLSWENARVATWSSPADGARGTVTTEVVTVGRELVDDPDRGPYQRFRHARIVLRFSRATAVANSGDDPASLDLLAGDVRIARGELDHGDGADWVLRLLATPTGALTIAFRDVSITAESVDDSEDQLLEQRPPHGWSGPVPDGWTALATPIVRAAAEGDLGGLSLVIARDHVDVNARDPRWGFAPLHAAAWFDRAAVASALLASGAVADLRDAEDRTPLTLAIDRDSRSAVDALIPGGADLEARDADGNTPIVRAAYTGRAEIVRRLAAAGARLDTTGAAGATILIAAADANDVDTIRAALDLGADRSATDEHGRTALDHVLAHHDTGAAELLR
jgi:hypothetical protein